MSPGLGVPTYVVDGMHGAGKIPLMPNYLLSASDDAVVLRNYEGMIFRYAPEDKQAPAKPIVSDGVSGVLSGEAQAADAGRPAREWHAAASLPPRKRLPRRHCPRLSCR